MHLNEYEILIYMNMKTIFDIHIDEKIAKENKGLWIIHKLVSKLPRECRVTVRKSFVRPHIDYSDIIYDQPNNDSFSNIIEGI